MKRLLFSLVLVLIALQSFAQKPKHYFVEIKTNKGIVTAMLYNETPKHRDNFKKLVSEKYYDGILFHRVIKNFMIQGGDPESKLPTTTSLTVLGNGGPDYRINAEIQEGLFHKKGTLGAARDNNPAKSSSGSQFYIVQGRKFTDAGLDSLVKFRMQGKEFSSQQREAYKSVGGTPHLDGNYTVFGEVINGIESVDNIAAVATNSDDRPITDEPMYIRLLTRREAINTERQLAGLKPKNGFFTKLFDSFKSKNYKL
ncbi:MULTISPECIES: peptidylprolyl isomerase [Sphingobacterium]|uniref:Peptidyl-prolyl cis-trans isomerase n=1 Tax=Sphingobacterium litopenaei TaxID=2763500 RepID=A0ABR7YI76_9SPHI|nr:MULTISPECIES: peptidylprolyl isomerase [Sphingobacterium]MBD1431022.1 peptidylprolyl isomerase [Sphingobacterium litopenaei]NGM74679.1 peptidylprolyl isomerase [Sphingobacterium sp. SGL-16]